MPCLVEVPEKKIKHVTGGTIKLTVCCIIKKIPSSSDNITCTINSKGFFMRHRLSLPRQLIARNMSSPSSIVQHYTEGSLMSRILAGLSQQGMTSTITAQQLYPIDQFHVGGLKALKSLLSHVDINPGCRVLDLGCGLGGTCRVIASQQPEAIILGVDLTPEFIEVSKELTSMVQMEGGITYEVGSATDIPAADSSIDLVVMVYVGK